GRVVSDSTWRRATPKPPVTQRNHGGESGIRTHVRVSPKHAFQACAFSHSAISPALIGKRCEEQIAGGNLLALILWASAFRRNFNGIGPQDERENLRTTCLTSCWPAQASSAKR